MYIDAFHIDGFGIFSNVDCKDLSPGLNIFYGQNEAGKSTCLEFIRTMLTGYPERKIPGPWEPLAGGHPGGSLILRSDLEPHFIRLMRSPASLGGLRLSDSEGNILHSAILNKIFGHVDREAYRRVFGFGLYELEQWDKKSEESIRNALYGASFGPGLISPRQVQKDIASKMDKIYKGRGNQQALNKTLSEIERLHALLQGWTQSCEDFDKLASELDRIESQLDNYEAKKFELENERRYTERRLENWRNWDQWRNLGAKIERMESIPEQLPENALERARKLQEEVGESSRAVTAARARLGQMEERLDNIEVDTPLLNAAPELRRLAESKSSYRKAKNDLEPLRTKLEVCKKELLDTLAQLGPGWTCDQIRKTDRSLFAREGIEKKASALNEARLALQTDIAVLEKANREVQTARDSVKVAEEALGALPDIEAELTEGERDELRGSMTRLEENRRLAPGRQRALENAVQTFNRALGHAQILGTEEKTGEKILANILSHQEEVGALSEDIALHLKECETARETVKNAERDASSIRSKIEDIKSKQREAGGQTREILDQRSAALRSLRNLGSKLEAETAQKNEIDARIKNENETGQLKNWTLIIFAIIFLAIAAAIMAAHWILGLQEFVIARSAIIPINLWAAYAALVCGLILLASGLSGHGPEQKRRKREYERLLNNSQAATLKLTELNLQSQELCKAVGLDDFDPISLDAMELLLEREKEQLFHEERAQREIEELEVELERQAETIMQLQADASQKDNAVQQLRRKWHNLMQSLNVSNVPSPESFSTVLERANFAKIAEQNVENAQEELDALWEDLHLLESAITSMPAIKAKLEASDGNLSLEEAVRQTLESCREADQTRDIRNRLRHDLDLGKSNLERALARQQQAADKKSESQFQLEKARDEWISSTDSLGLPGELDPETVREAYRFMGVALELEDESRKTERELEITSQEIQAFEAPVEKILKNCGIEAIKDSSGKIDWLLCQEHLLSRAEGNQRAEERKQDLLQTIETQKEETTALTAVFESMQARLNEFLADSGARDINEIEKFVHIRESKRSLLDRKAELEASLAYVAKDMPLAQFLESFASTDEENQETRLLKIKVELAELEEKTKDLTGQKAILTDKRKRIETSPEPALLRQQIALLEARAARLATEWSSLAFAETLLNEARLVFEKERQPEIIRDASGIFASITDYKWKGIGLNLENSNLMILAPNGESVSPETLSRGAQEQAYLALRLAYIRSHANSFECLPVIMDEILVNFDPERAKRCARTFAAMAKNEGQQIIYFTCQPHIMDMLKESAENAAVYRVENGTIQAA